MRVAGFGLYGVETQGPAVDDSESTPAPVCPAVAPRATTARISADFPLPFEVAQDAVFTACRNEECQPITLHGEVEGDPNPALVRGNGPQTGDSSPELGSSA